MICPVCEGDKVLPQYDDEGGLNHFSECWLCNGNGKVIYKNLPWRIKVLLGFSIAQEEEINKFDNESKE